MVNFNVRFKIGQRFRAVETSRRVCTVCRVFLGRRGSLMAIKTDRR